MMLLLGQTKKQNANELANERGNTQKQHEKTTTNHVCCGCALFVLCECMVLLVLFCQCFVWCVVVAGVFRVLLLLVVLWILLSWGQTNNT